MNKTERIKELVKILNEASLAYYQKAEEIMSNLEYDKLYDELVKLEKETGVVLANSPTVNVGYEVVSELPKFTHKSPMLSLDKTKEVEELKAFTKDKKSVLSWKLDGLTVVLTYSDGKLVNAVTRGNGQVGEVITANAKTFKNIPLNISYKGELTLRGEAIIKYSDFNRINEEIQDADAKYKNPRNLCSGSVRQLNSEITASRSVNFIAFAVIEAEGVDFNNSIDTQLSWLESQGFETVERKVVDKDSMEDAVNFFAKKIVDYDYPSDGLVLMFDDIEYGLSLGRTAKFPRNGIAFKWKDEMALTKLKEIEWSASRTGLINPVAIFEPVELEGTTVSRASVHNLSIVEELELGIGDEISVYKANMIIPQIAENKTKSGNIVIPDKCPVCNSETVIKNDKGVKTLHCTNRDCPAKHVKNFSLFVSRDAMNIDGLSEETLEKFIDSGYIKEFRDLYHLDQYKDEIINTPGFGELSYNNIVNAVEKSRKVMLHSVLYAVGIPNIGVANAKLICKAYNYDLEKIVNATVDDLVTIDGIGDIMAAKYVEYFSDKDNRAKFDRLILELDIEKPEVNENQSLEGMTFVVTGSLTQFENRNALKAYIEDLGGKVTGSVSAKTNYLINNDIESSSSKNKKAKQLNIPIITEDMFIEQFGK